MLLEPLDRGEPITTQEMQRLVEDVAATYSASLPVDYLEFLRYSNGADGRLANGFPLVLWAAEVLPEANEANLVEGWMPGCFAIGSDAGDAVFGIDLREDAPPERYLETDDVGMDWDYVFWRGVSFLELLRHLLSESP